MYARRMAQKPKVRAVGHAPVEPMRTLSIRNGLECATGVPWSRSSPVSPIFAQRLVLLAIGMRRQPREARQESTVWFVFEHRPAENAAGRFGRRNRRKYN